MPWQSVGFDLPWEFRVANVAVRTGAFCTAAPPWEHRAGAVASAWGSRDVFLCSCVHVFMCSCFCMTAVGRAVLGAVAERGGAAGGAAPGGVRGSTAGRALDVSTAPSLLHRIGCVRECQCPSANILH